MEALELDNLKQISGGDEQFVLDMLRIYLKNLPAMLNPLEEAFEKNDIDQISRAAHKLKSASGAAGAVLVLQHADIIEQMAIRGAEIDDLAQQHEELKESLTLTIPAIKKHLEIS